MNEFFLKFAIDRLFSCMLLMIVVPLIMLIGLAMWIESLLLGEAMGNVFYREDRVSRGRPFRLYKFRVLKSSVVEKMTRQDSVWFLQFNKKNTTWMGKILIKFYLDEMPQILNIFLGQMTFVGPRPRIPSIYKENIKEGYKALKYLKGGITGPAQLAKGVVDNGLPLSEEYMEKCNSYGPFKLACYDLGVMGKTVLKIMKGEGL